ncbi:MAG: hypothetical protein HY906_14555, partial [Deltaproteobacteria bacterium]|nr:hypothetical protein [Deltaproteobacteria bacterium]
MRSFLAAALALSLVWASSASAQPAYGEDDDPDENPSYGGPEAVPTPPPPPAAAPSAAAPPLPAAPDDQQTWNYNGPHAVNAAYGSGFCNIRGVHSHPYPPFDDHLFQEQDGGYNFLGDPVDFGYTGDDLTWYNAVHPIAIGWGIGWCFMTWAHHHFYRPWGPYFSACGPYFCYSGPYDAYYWRWRGYWTPYWGAYYPRFYRGGLYYRTRLAASPGRWAHVGARHPGGHLRHPGGALRPGGYARPLPGHAPGALRGHASPYSRLPHATPVRPGMRVAPAPHANPRMAPPRAAPPSRVGPAPRTFSPPRSHGAPHFSAPKSFGPSRSSSPSRSSASS